MVLMKYQAPKALAAKSNQYNAFNPFICRKIQIKPEFFPDDDCSNELVGNKKQADANSLFYPCPRNTS